MNARLLIVLTLLAPLAAAENWPCFRGPSRQGDSTEKNLPLKWSATENVAWKTPIPGEAWSSPIVWGDRVFVTTATDKGATCRVIALNRDTGQIIWDKQVHKQTPKRKEGRNSYATPTPCTDGQRVYAVFGDGTFVALTMDGEIAWSNTDYPFYSQHGLGASPLLFEDLLIMPRDGSSETGDLTVGWQKPWDKSFVVALDKSTGKEKWKTPRGQSRIAHVTPNLWTNPAGQTQLITGAGDVVQAMDAKSGALIWTAKNIGEGVVPSVVIADNLAITGCGFAGRDSVKAFKLGDFKGDVGETTIAWENKRTAPKLSSYVYVKPYLFMVNEAGIAACLNAQTGEQVWRERLEGGHSASPVAADGRVYFLSDNGDTTVIEAGPKFNVLATNPLGEKSQASMAVSAGRLFIRTAGNLYCIR